MKTTFARWLVQHEMTPFLFHKHAGVPYRSIRLLAGIGDARGPQAFLSPLLSRVSEITGIAMEVLVNDAEAARADPTPARKYVRKAAAE